MPPDQELVVKELIVTGPLKERLYELFSRVYAGRQDVRVIMDRRTEGRRRPGPQAPERRRRPPTWVFPPPD